MMTASLAVTDLSLGVVIIWCALGWVPSVMISATLLAPVPCLVMICWFSTSGVASMLNITLIAADRYLYVVHPYFHTRLVTPRSTAACVTVVWLLAVAAFCTIGGLLNSAMNFFVYVIGTRTFGKSLCPVGKGEYPLK
nr:hypothetical protein BaRGS_017584 [Batillaria attramentaria]